MTATVRRVLVPDPDPAVPGPECEQYLRHGLPERLPMPVYRRPRGGFRPIVGHAAETWPYPRVLDVDGSVFVEMPWGDDWGITFHTRTRPLTPLGEFISQYAEGTASGFPWWPVVVFSARVAWRRATRRRRGR